MLSEFNLGRQVGVALIILANTLAFCPLTVPLLGAAARYQANYQRNGIRKN